MPSRAAAASRVTASPPRRSSASRLAFSETSIGRASSSTILPRRGHSPNRPGSCPAMPCYCSVEIRGRILLVPSPGWERVRVRGIQNCRRPPHPGSPLRLRDQRGSASPLDFIPLILAFSHPGEGTLMPQVTGKEARPNRRHIHPRATRMLRSTAGAEWVSAPTEIRSTPDSATARTVSRVTPPEASTRARPR